MNNYIQKLSIILFTCLLSLFFISCEAGMSKQQRLNEFKSDIRSGSNPRENFQGDPLSSSINSSVFYSNYWHPDFNIDFPSSDIIGSSTFSIFYSHNLSGGIQEATGYFYNAGNGGISGDDWYIKTIYLPDEDVTIPPG